MASASENCDKAANELLNAANRLKGASEKFALSDSNGGAGDLLSARGHIVKAERMLTEVAEDRVAKPSPPNTGCALDSMVFLGLILGIALLIAAHP